MASKRDGSSIFWTGVVIAGIVYYLSETAALAAIIALAVMFLMWLLRGTGAQGKQEAQENVESYLFDFDALTPAYKSQLLKQQFGHFFKLATTSNGNVDFYCSEDSLDGYRFSFWVKYLIKESSQEGVVKVRKGEPICIVYISSYKGKSGGYEKFTINAPIGGIVVNIFKGILQKGVILFSIKKEEKVVEVVNVKTKVAESQDIPRQEKYTIRLDDIVVEDLAIPNDTIEVEDLDDVLRWEMPTIDDIEMPKQEAALSASDPLLSHHAAITNLSDFDWYEFKAICYSSSEGEQKEVRLIGDVKIGGKVFLSSNYDMFYLEGKDRFGVEKRFRPFVLEKDSDITVTTIFIEHHY